MLDTLKKDYVLLVGLLSVAVLFTIGSSWFEALGPNVTTFLLFFWIFGVMLWSAFRVVHHADMLSLRLKEPLGTLILTIAVIIIEVSIISTVMTTGKPVPSLGRDMMFSVIMIVMNGIVGLSLIWGSLKYKEQTYNLQGANTYLAILILLSMFGLILPNFSQSSSMGTFSSTLTVFEVVVSICLYGVFLVEQSIRHRELFVANVPEESRKHAGNTSIPLHAIMILVYMTVIVILSDEFAKMIDFGIIGLGAPVALGGVFVAILVLAPEGITAIKAAIANNLQRSVNVTLGSALSTIGLTIPAVLLTDIFLGHEVVLGLGPEESFLLIVTLMLSIVTYSSAKTNIIHGLVHFVVFLLYMVLIFD